MIMARSASPAAERLSAYALFAGVLAGAGLPIYIHAPKFYVDEYGVSLASLGGVLFALRLLDVVQDPLLGRLSDRLRQRRGSAVTVAVLVLVGAMLGLFAVPPLLSPVIWFAVMLTLVFSAFSFLNISFYAQGVIKADQLGKAGHLLLARWRETGALLGVCAAAVAPVALMVWMDRPFAGFAVGFGIMAMAALGAMWGRWEDAASAPSGGVGRVLRDPVARRLLLIALLNAAPVAVSSTLFLFYVESRLGAPGSEGGLLLLFFLAAACAAPVWGLLAQRLGARRVLAWGMMLSILSFGGALFLGTGDLALFAVICAGSGAALGADMTVLPALFARRMAQIAPSASDGFGLWSFVSKFTLAFAAVLLLPALGAAGFQSGAQNPEAALTLLSLFYAGLPCLLKSVALVLLVTSSLEEN